MEASKNISLVQFNPNTVEEIREELSLNQDGITQMLDNFEDWVAKQQHFTKKDFSRTYLETCIIHAKGSLEKAKTNLDKLCTLKTLLPIFFEKHDVKKELITISGTILAGPLPKPMKNNHRISFVKFVSSELNEAIFLDFYRLMILTNEYMRMHDYTYGFSCVIDCRDVNILSIVTKINIIDLRKSMAVLMEGYGLKINAIYLISSSKTIDVFVRLLNQVLSDKISGRINVIKTVEDLHEHIPKELLPKEYGGDEKTFKEMNEDWMNVLSTKENVEYFKEICQARTDEKYRMADKYNEQVLGMPGSFRTLSVD